jgi:hypothetical protein
VFSVAREINFLVISIRGAEIWSQVARETKARSVAPSICVSSLRSVLCFILLALAPRIVKWQPSFLLFVLLISCTHVLVPYKRLTTFFGIKAFCVSLKGRFVLEWGIGEGVEGRGRGLF